MIIARSQEVKRIKETKKWSLVFGRRKTGKTFLVRNFIKSDEYFFVKTDKGILSKDNEQLSYETFLQILKRSLEDNKTVVVDEFHRLGNDFFDFLHSARKDGKLILLSSTLFLSKKMISEKSALLGLFAENPIGLISLRDGLKALNGLGLEKKELLEMAIILREPIAIDYFEEKKRARETMASVIAGSVMTIPALIGEIFSEEERDISAVYEGILRAIASGKVGSGEIANDLFSKKIIKKNDPSIISQYLNNLVSFGIIKKIDVFNKKRFVYKLISPLSRIFYYADEKYNLSERKLNEGELLKIIDEIMPRIVEDEVREFIAEKNGLRESLFETGDFEIDGCLLKFKKTEIALEVKWKEADGWDLRKAEENLNRIEAKRKIIFVPDKKGLKSSLEIIDVDDLLK